MRYEIKKILSCKILMISMIVAFIFSMAISYNAYANDENRFKRVFCIYW